MNEFNSISHSILFQLIQITFQSFTEFSNQLKLHSKSTTTPFQFNFEFTFSSTSIQLQISMHCVCLLKYLFDFSNTYKIQPQHQ